MDGQGWEVAPAGHPWTLLLRKSTATASHDASNPLRLPHGDAVLACDDHDRGHSAEEAVIDNANLRPHGQQDRDREREHNRDRDRDRNRERDRDGSGKAGDRDLVIGIW